MPKSLSNLGRWETVQFDDLAIDFVEEKRCQFCSLALSFSFVVVLAVDCWIYVLLASMVGFRFPGEQGWPLGWLLGLTNIGADVA
jgi:hypothetical protein